MKEQQWLEDGWFYHNHAWHLLHEFLKLIREVDNVKYLLDVGAGTGIAAAVIRAVFPDIKQITVMDIEDNSNFWIPRHLTGVIDFKLITYNRDIILCSHVLEHIEEPVPFIQKLFSLTKKRLIIAVPDGDVHFYDHKVIYRRDILEDTIRQALEGQKYTYKGFPVYHAHMNNLIVVVDRI